MNKQELLVQCSSGNNKRLRIEPSLSQQLLAPAQQLQTIEDEIDVVYEPMQNYELGEECTSFEEANEVHATQDSPKNVWVEAPTKLLLSLVDELSEKVGKTVQLKTKKKMWNFIRERLVSAGYEFSLSQIEGKYRSLERQFKKTKGHNSQTGRNRLSCQFESEMSNILQKKRGMFPEYILGSEESLTRNDLLTQAGISTQDLTAEPCKEVPKNNHPQQKVKSTSGTMKELQKIREEKADFHSKALKLMEEKASRDQKKIDLLEKILEKLN